VTRFRRHSFAPQMTELSRNQVFIRHGMFSQTIARRKIHQTIDGIMGYFGVVKRGITFDEVSYQLTFQAGNARVAEKAGPAIKSSFPSRMSSGPLFVLWINSISIPSCLKKPSSTAAIATKYEGESKSGTHIRYM